MANVLPTDARATVWRMYRSRFLLVASLAATAIGIFFALAFVPSYITLKSSGAGELDTAAKQNATTTDQVALTQTQALLRALSSQKPASTTPSEVIMAALSVRPAGITINHLTYQTGKTNTLVIVGSSQTRDAISAYDQALHAEGHFNSVAIPVSALAGTEGGHFTATLSGDF
jgi:zona occludens toxin (predicted ATPase)